MSNNTLVSFSLPALCLTLISSVAADSLLTEPMEKLTIKERTKIGHAICEDSKFTLTENSLNCLTCPSYTGQPGDNGGLLVENIIRSNFTSTDSDELLLDTRGCEAHYTNFGGAILLRNIRAGLSTTSPSKKANDKVLEFQFYRPGFRLNDCLSLEQPGKRTQLVCNEHWMGQGEVIGHISAIEILNQAITRWRLFRWYDNSSTESSRVISVLPEEMNKSGIPGKKQQTIDITVSIVDTPRPLYETSPGASRTKEKLRFIQEGERFIADEATRTLLGKISSLTRNETD